MTRYSANYLTITTVCAVLLAGAGISQASPDLGERANANAKSDTASDTAQSSSWPPRITKPADTATGSSAAVSSKVSIAKSRNERIRKAALEAAPDTKSDVTEPKAEATERTADATEPQSDDIESKTDTTEPSSTEKNTNWDEPRRYKRATYYDDRDEISWRVRHFRSDLRRAFRSPVRFGHIRFGRRWF
jgi:hypothetical protein